MKGKQYDTLNNDEMSQRNSSNNKRKTKVAIPFHPIQEVGF